MLYQPPEGLSDKLLSSYIDAKRSDWLTARKELRNQLRKYSAISIAQAAMNVLWHQSADPLEKLRFAPWQTLLLVKLALLDNMVHMTNAPPITQAQFDVLRQKTWDVGGAARSPANLHLFLRQIVHAQIEFQRKPTFSFLRQPALIARLQQNNLLRQKFIEIFGLDPNSYIDLAIVSMTAILDNKRMLSKAWFAPMAPVYGDAAITRFLSHLSRDLSSLRVELQSAFPDPRPCSSELFEFPVIKRFPLLCHADGSFECWHPFVFARGLEELVHQRFSALGAWYSDRYSKIFEEYVVELISGAGWHYFDDTELKARLGGRASVPDAVIDFDHCNIFVESKMGLFADSLLVEDSTEHFRNRTKALRKAIHQGWEISVAIRDGRLASERCSQAKEDFLFVVTNRELNLSRGELFTSMYPKGGIPYPSDTARQYLPLSNIFFMSIDEFERLIGSTKQDGRDIYAMLCDAVKANANPSTSTYYFSDHLKRSGAQWPNSSLIESTLQASLQRIRKCHFVE